MNETCDRCRPAVRAAYRAVRSGQLYLCQHFTDVMMPYLGAPFFAEGSPDGMLDTLALIAEISLRMLVHGRYLVLHEFHRERDVVDRRCRSRDARPRRPVLTTPSPSRGGNSPPASR